MAVKAQPVKPAPVAQRCGGTDIIGPFQMDGVVDGVTGVFWWQVCRGCGRTTHVPEAA